MKWLLLLCCAYACVRSLHADEGYWLFSDPPITTITDKYHVTLDQPWLDHLRESAVKIGGASGSFVSEDGLVITNRHVVEGQLHTLSTSAKNYERDGFYAPTPDAELPCHGLEMLVLQRTENVTDRVRAAVPPGATPAQADAANKAVMAEIEKEAFDRTGLQCDVITFFGGARYDLYEYRKYPDVRIVFSPDAQAATFGGDTDNFEFPRFDLDVSLLRIYDHGRPLHSRDYLKWNSAGPAKDQLIFVAGHPGASQRLVTIDDLEYQRDVRLPFAVSELQRLEKGLAAFSATPEHAREASEQVASIANSRKAYLGFLHGLRDENLFEKKAREESAFRASLAQNPGQKAALDAYARVQEAVAADRKNFAAYQVFERFAPRSDTFNIALTLVRAAAERAKPNGERLPAYWDNALPSLQFRLFSGRPFYPDLEVYFLSDSFETLVREFGAADPLMVKLLAGKTPHARAEELVHGTQLENIADRKKLYTGGENEIRACHDPMIALAAAIDPAARAARKIDDEDDETRRRAYATIYQARVELNETPAYPDATNTLRLADGTVTGWSAGGNFIEPFTDIGGLFARAIAHQDQPPFDVPPAWAKAKPELNLKTPLNFASTADILGGNSGSPVVNQQGEFVGIIFDGNEPSLAGRYLYDPALNRAVAVDSAAIVEALRKIYHAGALADELESGRLKR